MNKSLADGHEMRQKTPATALSAPCDPVPLGEFLLLETRFPAVYLLMKRGMVVYVGQSKTLRSRIETHLTERIKDFDAVAFQPCSVNHLTRIEGEYIRRYAPKYNSCPVAKRQRQRDGWEAERSRDTLRRSLNREMPLSDDGPFKFIDAADVMIDDQNVGDFLSVTDADAAAWLSSGAITDQSALGLIIFVATHGHEVRRAQAGFAAG